MLIIEHLHELSLMCNQSLKYCLLLKLLDV